MTPTIVFYISLTGLLTMVGLKLYEMNRGVKPFSVLHYKTDMALRKHAAIVNANLRYLNRETVWLFFLFLFSKGTAAAKGLWSRVEHLKLFEKIRGRNIMKGSGAVSAFLRKLSEKKLDSESPVEETTEVK